MLSGGSTYAWTRTCSTSYPAPACTKSPRHTSKSPRSSSTSSGASPAAAAAASPFAAAASASVQPEGKTHSRVPGCTASIAESGMSASASACSGVAPGSTAAGASECAGCRPERATPSGQLVLAAHGSERNAYISRTCLGGWPGEQASRPCALRLWWKTRVRCSAHSHARPWWRCGGVPAGCPLKIGSKREARMARSVASST
mmetsp:Transcript_12080/g.24561  ORF Transcript_12080/g.24561 Transcript_12080/m.24561 type:complete len:202 (-) Transcript_12080:127-732(-)